MASVQPEFAFVTLLNSSSYLPGALVLAHSLRELHPQPRQVEFHTVCLVTPETVDVQSIKQLRSAFDVVIGVEVITSGAEGEAGLQLMGRPDLHSALTKLHIFRLSSKYNKVVYLDADVLPLRPLSHLFALPNRFSACPDSGWPDCFNSGVMVFEPNDSDFEGMMKLMEDARTGDVALEGLGIGSGNGSFDGADQGLLNEWFSEEGGGGDWNRLSFTYNVTPSAAYQYAPAYRRYGSKIHCVHFIGNNKPWRSIITRPARAPTPNIKDMPFDYPSLVDRWFAVYDRYMRPLGQPVANPVFSVPQNVAVWNQPALSTAEGRAQMSDMGASSSASKSAAGLALQGGSITAAQAEGIYTSMPLGGRIDLMRPQPIKPSAPSPQRGPSLAGSPPIYAQSLPHNVSIHPPARQGSPPISDTWNAQYDSPPRRSGPEYGEMRGGMPENYENAWDKPLGHQQRQSEDWNVAGSYPQIPDVVKEDKWYAGAADGKPDYSKVETVFPWEQKQRQPPSRHFPASDPPPPQAAVAPVLRLQLPSPPAPEDIRLPPSTATSPFTGQNKRPVSFHQAMAQYTNAWDIPSIQNYASRLAGPKERKALAKGMQTPALERENPLGILLADTGDRQQKVKSPPARPVSKRNRRSSEVATTEARSEGSRDGDDEETTSGSDGEPEDERYPIVRRGAGRPAHSRTGSKLSSTGTSPAAYSPDLGQKSGSKQYTARSVQTDPVPMQDQVVQTSPEQRAGSVAATTQATGPSSWKFGKANASPGAASSDIPSRPKHVRQSSEETVTHASYNSPKTDPTRLTSEDSATSSPSSDSRPKPTSRIFDPSTSIDARRRDTVEVLSRFMRQAGSPAGGSQVPRTS